MAHIEELSILALGAGNRTAPVQLPARTLALVGISWSPIGSFTSHVQLAFFLTNFGQNFLAFRGRKIFRGCMPTQAGATVPNVSVVVASADAAITYTIEAHVLVADQQDQLVALPFIPFEAEGGAEGASQIVLVTATSAATTALTVDVAALGNVDAIQPLAAWFQTNTPSTATGNTGAFDGSIRVDIDTTVAVANYFFNLGKSGSQIVLANLLGGSIVWRTVIGAAAAGTSTLYLVYRALLIR